MIYEFVVGKRESNNYIKEGYTAKIEVDLPYSKLSDIVAVFDEHLTKAFKDMEGIPMECVEVKSSITKLVEELKSDTLDSNKRDLASAKFRECLALFSFFDIEVYLLERPDLASASEATSINRVYLIDNYDKVFPELSRVGTAYTVSFDNNASMSPADMVFSLIGRSIRFSQSTSNLLNIEDKIESYEKMMKIDAAWQMDVSKIMRFLDEYGYKLVGVLA